MSQFQDIVIHIDKILDKYKQNVLKSLQKRIGECMQIDQLKETTAKHYVILCGRLWTKILWLWIFHI